MTVRGSNSAALPAVLCLHSAGATAAMFAGLAEQLRGRVAVETVELPGRGATFGRAPLRTMAKAVDHVLPLVWAQAGRRYLLLGYSMGALIAYELARRLHDGGGPLPIALIVLAARAPQVIAREGPLHKMDDARLLEELVRLQGTMLELLADRELMALVLPRLRADFELCETYAFRPGLRLPIPIHAVGGLADEKVTAADLSAWSVLTEADASCEQLPGGHFFIQGQEEVLATRIAAITAATSAGLPEPLRGAGHG